MRYMDFQQLNYFKTVAEMGKISDAADSLFMSAPALSLAISRLEKELGVSLFDRRNNKIILNRQGQIFLRYAKQVLSDLVYTKAEIRQSMTEKPQHVSLTCTATTQWVHLIAAFSQEYPNFTLSCNDIMSADLAAGGWTVHNSLLLAAEDDVPAHIAEELDSTVLFEDQPVIMVHPEHPLAQEPSVNICQLHNETLFIPLQSYSLYRYLVKLFESSGLAIPGGNAYSHLMAQQLVAKGLGVGFAAAHYVRNDVTDIRYIPIRDLCHPWVFRLYWRRNRTLTDDERVLKNFVESYYRE